MRHEIATNRSIVLISIEKLFETHQRRLIGRQPKGFNVLNECIPSVHSDSVVTRVFVRNLATSKQHPKGERVLDFEPSDSAVGNVASNATTHWSHPWWITELLSVLR